MQLDILGGSYLQRYKDYNSQRTINYYCVPGIQDEKNKNKTALFPTPGLTLYVQPPVGRYNRGSFTARTAQFTRCFKVVDQTLYEITNNQTLLNRGTMSNLAYGASKVYITCDSQNEVGIFHTSASYVFNMNTNALTQITTLQFPGTISYACYSDTYTFVICNGSVYYNLNSNLGANPGGWLLTQTYTPSYASAPCKAVIALHEEIYNFTSETIETFINDGTSPYSRLPRSTVSIGLTAIDSLCKTNDGFIFVGKSASGESDVYFFDSYYSCNEIAPLSCNWILNSSPESLADAYATLQYSRDGHVFYRLTVPQLNTTYVFDYVTKSWTEQQSQAPMSDSNGDTVQSIYRGRHYTNFAGMHLWEDLYSSKTYVEDYSNFTEDSTPIIRTRISQTYWDNNKNISVFDLELDTNTGYGTSISYNPMMMISTSRNGGYTYGAPRNISLGRQGDHSHRARLRKLGTSRVWTLKLVVSDPVDIMLQNATATGTTGSL